LPHSSQDRFSVRLKPKIICICSKLLRTFVHTTDLSDSLLTFRHFYWTPL